MSAPYPVQQPTELLAFLLVCRPGVKKTTARQWLKHKSVQVNGQPMTHANHALQPGDLVMIRDKQEGRVEGLLPTKLKVLFEDPTLIVIDKPEGLLSMANEVERDKTAYSYLTDYVRRGNPKSQSRVWIVHRLDRETSGIMIFSKTEPTKIALQAQWSDVEKRYLAVVEGAPPAESGTLRSFLDENGPYKVYSAHPSERSREAITHYRVIKQTTDRALIELSPKTGRRNQLRVQLADIGCPIVGDQKYDAQTNPARRLGLHASYIQFEHPTTSKQLQFESPLPQVLARLV